ncbi:MAG: N-acetyl sugar amidotransferase [Anaerolineales bacterium]|nr:N-acetyl sugar amidotransferase [Anaerolineales bacterium]MBX3038103.1 N-acetyl sugar amidotransferase [Anaerolineales bacterium]
MKRCSRCLYDETVPNISFDENGVCNYCHVHDQLEAEYPTGEAGRLKLESIASQVRSESRNKPYDVIVGVSGGADSSYMVYLAKQLGLRPLAVHFDNTWDSTVAVENIQNVLQKLDVDLYTYVVDNKEYDDIYRSFLKAGVPDVEAPTDIGLAAVLNMAAEKYKIKYVFEGHSFRTEGVAPLGWIYMDGKYIQSVQKQYGTMPLKTYPNMLMPKFIQWSALLGLKKIRPLYYIDYVKKEAMAMLTQNLGWEWYGGHHLENRFTAFWHTYFMPKRFNVDTRLLGHAALVRSGQITREQGLDLINAPQPYDAELVEMVKKRLGFTDEEFEKIINAPKRTYRDFKTYKKTFERMRPFWWLMYKLNRVPKSFYMKFCFPDPLDIKHK